MTSLIENSNINYFNGIIHAELPKANYKVIGECSICVEEMTKYDIISCDMCGNSSCKDCFKRFIIEHEFDSKCMHCKAKITREFLIQNLDEEWIKNDYTIFRQKHLFNIEKGKFPETQNAANAYIQAKDIITKLPFDPVTGRFKGTITNHTKYTAQFNTFHAATLCVMDYGRGWEDYDFESGLKKERTTLKKTIKCPYFNCAGIIPISDDDKLMCAMCYGIVCSKCQESTHGSSSHKCNEDTIKTVKDIRENTRSCPTCSALIFKIEGCDQMFCTQCNTTFSWDTARIERGFQHNPHYLDWVREKRMKRIANGENVSDVVEEVSIAPPCLEYITYEKLITYFPTDIWKRSFELRKKLPSIDNFLDGLPSDELYCLALRNFHSNILQVRSTAGNHANMAVPDNHVIRVCYLTNNMEEDDFKNEIERREYEWNENITLFYIYDMVFRSAGDIFHNIRTRKYHDAFIEIITLLEYGNKCLEEHDMIYKTCSMKFKKRPF